MQAAHDDPPMRRRPGPLISSSAAFRADAPNLLWVCDLTYLKTLEGFVYLAFVKDVFSRFVTGFQLAAATGAPTSTQPGVP